jgi:hypothetical protein
VGCNHSPCRKENGPNEPDDSAPHHCPCVRLHLPIVRGMNAGISSSSFLLPYVCRFTALESVDTARIKHGNSVPVPLMLHYEKGAPAS